MMYGLIMSIVGIAICISAVVTNSDNEDLADNIEVFFFKNSFKRIQILHLLLFFQVFLHVSFPNINYVDIILSI